MVEQQQEQLMIQETQKIKSKIVNIHTLKHPNMELAITIFYDGNMFVYDLNDKSLFFHSKITENENETFVTSSHLDHSSSLLYVGSSNGFLYRTHITSKTPFGPISVCQNSVSSISQIGKYLFIFYFYFLFLIFVFIK